MKSSGEFKAEDARKRLKGSVKYSPNKITRYPFKPFDVRLAYLDSFIQPLFSRPAPELLALQDISNNSYLLTRDTADKYPEGAPFYFSRLICDYDCISGHTRHFPLFTKQTGAETRHSLAQSNFLDATDSPNARLDANFSDTSRAYLASLGIPDPDANEETAGLVWMHALAIGYSPAYLIENADGIRQDWPRIPLPASQEMLLASAALGRQVAALLDTEHEVKGVTSGAIQPELRTIGVISREDGKGLNPEAGYLNVTAGWGHAGKEGATMPGKGKRVERDYIPNELNALGATVEQLGVQTGDVYLNDVAYWRNIPERVWKYYIGGYQVIKKWLSYREYDHLGRGLTTDEAREVTNMARRLAAIVLLEPQLDANYQAVKDNSYAWPDQVR
ncbi:MAG: type ISP restriction/modification enzyme [Anaerolineae bacterium]